MFRGSTPNPDGSSSGPACKPAEDGALNGLTEHLSQVAAAASSVATAAASVAARPTTSRILFLNGPGSVVLHGGLYGTDGLRKVGLQCGDSWAHLLDVLDILSLDAEDKIFQLKTQTGGEIRSFIRLSC